MRSAVMWLAFGSLAKRTQPFPRCVPPAPDFLQAASPLINPSAGVGLVGGMHDYMLAFY